MNAETLIRMEPSADELETLFSQVEGFGDRAEWSDRLTFQVKLILEELTLNVINYGSAGKKLDPIEIRLACEGDTLIIEITDVGQPFDPLTDAPSPDLSLALEDRPIGGLGLYLVRTMVDEMHYRWEAGSNHLKLITRRRA